jgi:hypothetical protein
LCIKVVYGSPGLTDAGTRIGIIAGGVYIENRGLGEGRRGGWGATGEKEREKNN